MTRQADLLVVGRVATLAGTSGWGWESGVAVAGGRVVATGEESELEALAGPATKRIRIPDGHVAMPGITHTYAMKTGMS